MSNVSNVSNVNDKQQSKRVLDGVVLDEIVELAEGLANIPSFSGDEGPVAEYVAGRMRAWGFDEVILQEAERGRPNAIGILRGDGSGIRFMYNGHLDIDPIPNGYDRPLWQCFREGGSLFGVGLGNMKAADAAMIMAAVAVKRSGLKLRGDLIVACVVGELQGGIGTTYLLKHGPVPEAAIVPEPTNLQIRTLHAGVLELLVTLRGRAVWAGTDGFGIQMGERDREGAPPPCRRCTGWSSLTRTSRSSRSRAGRRSSAAVAATPCSTTSACPAACSCKRPMNLLRTNRTSRS